jgi:hypothetical protein
MSLVLLTVTNVVINDFGKFFGFWRQALIALCSIWNRPSRIAVCSSEVFSKRQTYFPR